MTDERVDARIRSLDGRSAQSFTSIEPVPAAVLARVRAARRQDRTWLGRLARDARVVDLDVVRGLFRSRPMLAVAGPLLIGAALIGVITSGSPNVVPPPDRADRSSFAPLPSASAVVTATVEPSQPPLADHRGLLVFSTNGRLIVEGGDGSDRRLLTDGSVADYFPVWSPDGRQVAFFSQRCKFSVRCPDKGVDSTLVVIDADGTGRHVLRTGLQNAQGLRWLADGSGVIETAFRSSGGPVTERVDLDGSLHPATAQNPASWTSPDGSEVLSPNADGRDATSIQISNADGSASRVLARVPRIGGRLSIVGWSPDGQSVAYNVRSSRYGRDFETLLVRRDGTEAHAWPLPDDGWLDSWSRDGRWILVGTASAGGDLRGAYVVARADGSDPRPLSMTALGYEWASGGSWLLGLRSGPIDSPGVAAQIVVVDPAGLLDAVDIDSPGLLGSDWRAGG